MGDSYQKLPMGGRFWGHRRAGGLSLVRRTATRESTWESDRELQRHMPGYLHGTHGEAGRGTPRRLRQSIRGRVRPDEPLGTWKLLRFHTSQERRVEGVQL